MGVEFPMNKEERVRTFASGSSHAMTLIAVDLDEEGNAKKCMVEILKSLRQIFLILSELLKSVLKEKAFLNMIQREKLQRHTGN